MTRKERESLTKEQKAKAKWESKGRPRLLTDEMQIKQKLEQMGADFEESIMKSGSLVTLQYMSQNGLAFLIDLCVDELNRRGIGIRPKEAPTEAGTAPAKSMLVDAQGRALS